jgi:hypothetical protein
VNNGIYAVGEYDTTTGALINANFITGAGGNPYAGNAFAVGPMPSPDPKTSTVTAMLTWSGRTLPPVSVPSGS